jgi:hypothetical protein
METLVREDRYSHYDYEIWAYPDDDYPDTLYYYYKILDKGEDHHYWMGTPVIREADEYFDSAGEAALAAIGHIDLLESGEG